MAPQTIKLVVRMSCSGGVLSMQRTTSRIGAEGVLVRSLVPQIEGSRLELSLSLPGSARPVHDKGIVGPRTVESAKESGFWFQCDNLSDEARAFLDVLLRSRGVVGPGRAVRSEETVRADKPRAYPRVPARLRVGWTSARDFLVAYTENISRGGIFIATDDPPALREIVELSVELPDGLPPVQTRAEVVHSVTAAEARSSGRVAGEIGRASCRERV